MKQFLPLLSSFMFSAIITAVCIPHIIRIAHKRQLLDQPGGRKQHAQAVPALGGIAIYIGFLFAGFFWMESDTAHDVQFLLPALLLLFATGIADDVYALSPLRKLLIQFVSAVIVTIGGFRFGSLHGFLGISEIPVFMQIAVSVAFIMLMTNAFNLIDGVDGLAGGTGLTISLIFAILFYHTENYFYAALCACLAGALAGFLYFNFNPATIFMGDTGSLVIGFLLGVFGIHFTNQPPATLKLIGVENVFVVVCCTLFLPVFDVMRVFLVRMVKKRSPLHADRNHLHHILQKNGLSADKICMVEYAATLVFTFAGIYTLQFLPPTASFLLLLSGSVLLAEILTVAHLRRSRRKVGFRTDRIGHLRRKNQFLRHVVNS